MAVTAGRRDAWTFTGLKELLVETYNEWSNDKAPRLGAALAYYTILSLAPLLIVVIAIVGLAFGEEAARGQIQAQIEGMVGSEGAQAIQSMIEGAGKKSSGIIASLIGFITLLFGASSVVAELRSSMNTIWNVPENPDAGIKEYIKDRSYALGVVLGCGFLLLVALVVSAALAAAGKFIEGVLPLPEPVMMALSFIISLAVVTGIFAVLFKVLPNVEIPWNDVLLGAAFTAVLFAIGKIVLGMYLGKASFGSTYGAAGSLIIVLVWVYYSSQIFFFGAEFTQVYSRKYGSDAAAKLRPAEAKAAQPASASGKQPTRKAQPSHALAASGNAALPGGGVPPQESKIVAAAGSLLGGAMVVGRILRLFKGR